MEKSQLYLKIKSFILKQRIALIGCLVLLALIILLGILAGGTNKRVMQAQKDMVVLAENIRKQYTKKPDYWGLSTQSIIQNGIVPKSMLRNDKLFSPIAKETLVGADVDGNMVMPVTRSFYIIYKGLSKKNCVDMASYPMSEQNKLGLLSVTIVNEQNEVVFQWGGEYSLPIDKASAAKICHNNNIILWNFE